MVLQDEISHARGAIMVDQGLHWERLPAGDDGLVLTCDASQPLGMKWGPGGGGGGSGSVTSIATGTGLTGGPVTSTGTIAVATNGITGFHLRQSPASSLMGNPTASLANVADITLGAAFTFVGSALRTVAMTGDVTTAANSFATTIVAIGGAPLGAMTPTAGNVMVGSGTQWVTRAMSGDGTVSSTGAITVTKTGGVAFASSATIDATNASNISAGTLAAGRLPTTGLTISQSAGVITADTDAATITFNLATSNWHTVTLGGSRTLAISNPTVGQQFTFVLTQDGVGGRTVTWFSGITWSTGSVPTLSTAAGAKDTFTFKCLSAGVYLGFAVSVADTGGTAYSPISASISTPTNDWAPSGIGTATTIKITPSSTGTANALLPDLTGITTGSDGRSITLRNVGSFPLRITYNDSRSAAGNRFFHAGVLSAATATDPSAAPPAGNQGAYYLLPNDALDVVWDTAANGWLLMVRDTNMSTLYYGTGFDGNVAITTAVNAARNMYYQNLRISGGTGALNTAGWKVYVAEVFDVSAMAAAGLLRTTASNGGNAASATGGNGGPANSGNFLGANIVGGLGGNGTTTVGTNGAGGSGPQATNTNAGVGGAGGAGTSGAGGTSAAPTAATPQLIYGFDPTPQIRGILLNAPGVAGSGGAGGGGDGTNSGGGGGGGGASGNWLWLSARFIFRGTNSTAAIISAKGGGGSTAFQPTTGNCGGGGGGGGGAGGWVVINYAMLLGSTIANAIDVSGGVGGLGKAGNGTGTAGTGGTGGNGGRVTFVNLLSNTVAESVGAAGGAGSGVAGGTAGTFQVAL